MSEDLMLKCLIAFILGWFVSRQMGNGFSVGGGDKYRPVDSKCLKDEDCLTDHKCIILDGTYRGGYSDKGVCAASNFLGQVSFLGNGGSDDCKSFNDPGHCMNSFYDPLVGFKSQCNWDASAKHRAEGRKHRCDDDGDDAQKCINTETFYKVGDAINDKNQLCVRPNFEAYSKRHNF